MARQYPRLLSPLITFVLILGVTPSGASTADQGRAWNLTNILAGQGGSLGPHLSMQEAGNGVGAGSGYLLIQDGVDRIWIAPPTAPTTVEFGSLRWRLWAGSGSVVTRMRWVVGTWDWTTSSFSPLAGQEAVAQGNEPSEFSPVDSFSLPPSRRLALRIRGDGAPSLLDIYNEAEEESPTMLSVGDWVVDPVAAAASNANNIICSHGHIATSEQCPERWVARWSSPPETATGIDLATSPDESRVYVTGTSKLPRADNSDFVTVAFDARTGSAIWSAKLDGPATSRDRAAKIAVSPDGNTVYVAGYVCAVKGTLYCNLDLYFAAVAYDAMTGVEKWRKTFRPQGQKESTIRDLVVSPDGSTVLVNGQTTGSGVSGFDVLTVAYSATGTQLWTARYDGASLEDRPTAIDFSSDGATAYVAGWTRRPDSGFDWLLLAYDVSSGNQIAAVRRDEAGGEDRAWDLEVGNDAVYLIGTISGAPGSIDAAVVAYDKATLEPIWIYTQDGPWGGDERIAEGGIRISPDGATLYAAITEFDGSISADAAVLALDTSSGARLWATRWSTRGKFGDVVRGFDLSSDGSRIVLGIETGRLQVVSHDIVTLAFDTATGALVFEARYDGPGRGWDVPEGASLSSDGSTAFLVGSSFGYGREAEPPFELLLLAYDLP